MASRRANVRMQAVSPAAGAPEAPPPPPPLPAIKTMRVGDSTLAGDMNFDPLQIADEPGKLAWYREAEIKHARLAMLAAVGWPVSELTNFGNLLNGDGRAPSLLNGGLENVSSAYWGFVVAMAIYWEKQGLDKQFGKQEKYLPGMLGFDPLGMDSPFFRNAEITNGRVAMIAITAYAYEEFLTKAPIFPINLFTATAVGAGALATGAVSQELATAAGALAPELATAAGAAAPELTMAAGVAAPELAMATGAAASELATAAGAAAPELATAAGAVAPELASAAVPLRANVRMQAVSPTAGAPEAPP